MNTRQLQCAIDCDVEMKKTLIGVYAADNIPKKHHPMPYGFIVNTDPHQLPGKHWIACYIKNNVLETFDSYGHSPGILSPFIKRYMNTFERTLNNTKRLQSSETRVCGQYCFFYLMCRCRGFSMKDITNLFTHDFMLNDQFVYNFIDERFHCCMHHMSEYYQICTCLNKI